MNIVINTSNLNSGGALQVAFSVIYELNEIGRDHKFLVLASQNVYCQISKIKLRSNFEVKRVSQSPARIRKRCSTVALLNSYVKEFKGETVLTIFGPSYWKPKVKHICGFADGWCYNPDTIAYTQLRFLKKYQRKIISKYKLLELKRSSDFIFVETEDARAKLAYLIEDANIPIFVISNTYSHLYKNECHLDQNGAHKVDKKSLIKFLFLSANYPNKNIAILNAVIPILANSIEGFIFYLTIPNSDYKRIIKREIREYIINLGPLDVTECVSAYRNSDFLFLPSLLETFTANYPEAMCMQKPILTSKLSFAEELCGDAAIFFDPLDPEDISGKIMELIADPNKVKALIRLGLERVKRFPSSKDRAKNILELCVRNEK